MRRLTLTDVPKEVTFVDEDGNALPEYGVLRVEPWFAIVVLNNARRWRQSIDTTLERMLHKALRDFIRRARAAS